MKPTGEKPNEESAANQGTKDNARPLLRSAFGDLTNAAQKKADGKKEAGKKVWQNLEAKVGGGLKTRTTVAAQAAKAKKTTATAAAQVATSKAKAVAKKDGKRAGKPASEANSGQHVSSQESSSQESMDFDVEIKSDESVEMVDPSRVPLDGSLLESAKANQEMLPQVPDGVEDVDRFDRTDLSYEPLYAFDIFQYYKQREVIFMLSPYMARQPHVNQKMRAVLVDWMVEVQENFELNHETLYLAVKLVDTYLAGVPNVPRENVQLVGAVALYLSSKFDERMAPAISDFTYICDHAYNHLQFEAMERELFKTVDFELGRPISYRFLRRYAKCAGSDVKTLYLARFMLEMSLMEYKFVFHRDSMLAAACLYIARKMCKEGGWTPTLAYYSGYVLSELRALILEMNSSFTTNRYANLTTTRDKYKHPVFHSVDAIPHVSNEELF